ncbi:hypothetical protein [Parabacteroides distasonis]|uniref:hypothetical protein n=1 Tax=Parabacteroides distasonis TaxID=823 RepID=UPI0018AA4022|nr:hypothetical protein [Parabacteroides distasonis]
MVQTKISTTTSRRLCGGWCSGRNQSGGGNTRSQYSEKGLYDILCKHWLDQWYQNRTSQVELSGITGFHPKNRVAMFSLNGAVSYKYIPNYKDIGGGYDKFSGIVRSLGNNPNDGTAYVFTSKDQKLVKIIRHEHHECSCSSSVLIMTAT